MDQVLPGHYDIQRRKLLLQQRQYLPIIMEVLREPNNAGTTLDALLKSPQKTCRIIDKQPNIIIAMQFQSSQIHKIHVL